MNHSQPNNGLTPHVRQLVERANYQCMRVVRINMLPKEKFHICAVESFSVHIVVQDVLTINP